MQTLIFQALVTLLPFAAMIFYMFGFFVFIVLIGFGGNSSLSSSMGIASLVILLGSMLVTVGIAFVVPLFHILGQYAGYRVLKGDDYRYPVIGGLVEKWLSGKEIASTLSPPPVTAAGA